VKGEEGGYRLVINYDRLARYGEEFSKIVREEDRLTTGYRIMEIGISIKIIIEKLRYSETRGEYNRRRREIINIEGLIKLVIILITNYSKKCREGKLGITGEITERILNIIRKDIIAGDEEEVKKKIKAIFKIEEEDEVFNILIREMLRLIIIIRILNNQKLVEHGYTLIFHLAREMQTRVEGYRRAIFNEMIEVEEGEFNPYNVFI
jgi:hypothetical protein